MSVSWWAEPVPSGEVERYWRTDGRLVCTRKSGEVEDGVHYLASWVVQPPRYARGSGAIQGSDPEAVMRAADEKWAPSGLLFPKAGMAIWTRRGMFLIAAATSSELPAYPSLSGPVYRLALVPFEGLDRGNNRPYATEIPQGFWPRGFLIVDAGE